MKELQPKYIVVDKKRRRWVIHRKSPLARYVKEVETTFQSLGNTIFPNKNRFVQKKEESSADPEKWFNALKRKESKIV